MLYGLNGFQQYGHTLIGRHFFVNEMETTFQHLFLWAPLSCWAVAMVCFIFLPSRLRLLGPLNTSLRRLAGIGTFFFFLGLLFFVIQLLL